MKRRIFLSALGLALAGALRPMAAQASLTRADLDRLSAYLNGLGTVRTGFTQIAADGSQSRGSLLIRQPGRARFEYDPPARAMVLVGAGQIAIFDDRSNQGPQVYPLGVTPLAILLGRNIDLASSGLVAAQRQEAGRIFILGQDPERPEMGRIELAFRRDPLQLEGWAIVNAAGETTQVILDGLEPAEGVSVFDFDLETELQRRGLTRTD